MMLWNLFLLAALALALVEARMRSEYDFVIVGAGTAGPILAARLSENCNVNVLILERGLDVTSNPDVALPDVNGFSPLPVFNLPVENVLTREGAGLDPYRAVVPQALGGGPAVSGQAWTRGNMSNYDEWAAMGNVGWSSQDLLPYFRRTERAIDPYQNYTYDATRGTQGPIRNIRLDAENYTSEYTAIRQQLIMATGSRYNPDHNSWILGQMGFAPFQRSLEPVLTGTPVRSTTWSRYLEPVLSRPNLDLITGATVTRLNFNAAKTRARSVTFVTADSRTVTIRAKREIILTAGTLNTARILLQSGIGPAADLQALGIDVVRNLTGVGRNIDDHTQIYLGFLGIGFPNVNAPITVGFLKSPFDTVVDTECAYGTIPIPGSPFPFFLYVLTGVRNQARGELRLQNSVLLNTESRFTLNMRNYPQDADKIIWIFRIVRQIMAARGYPELTPGLAAIPANATDADFLAYFYAATRPGLDTYYHYTSSCRMGPASDAMSVVDQNLKVRGIQNLRIGDASIMPRAPSAHPSATVAAIAEYLSDKIRQQWNI